MNSSLSEVDIQQGSSTSSYSSVTSQTEGQGTVHTHIQSTVNGITKTLDSDKPGTYTVENHGDGSQMTSPPTTQHTLTQSVHIQSLPYLLFGGVIVLALLFYRKLRRAL